MIDLRLHHNIYGSANSMPWSLYHDGHKPWRPQKCQWRPRLFIVYFSQNELVKELWTSVENWQSYRLSLVYYFLRQSVFCIYTLV